MEDGFDIYNNTDEEVVCKNGTIEASGYFSVPAANAVAWAQDPIVQVNVLDSNLGVSVYGVDLGYGFQGPADAWLQRVAKGVAVY